MNEPEDDKCVRAGGPMLKDPVKDPGDWAEIRDLAKEIRDDVREHGLKSSALWATLGVIAVAAGVIGVAGLIFGKNVSEADQVIFFWMAVPFFIMVAIGVLVLFLYLALGLISMIPLWVWLILVLVLIFRH